MQKTSWKWQIVSSVAAIVGGLLIGYVDEHATEEIVTLGLVVGFNFVLAVVAPYAVWRFPLLVAGAGCALKWTAAAAWGAAINPHFPQTFSSYGLLALAMSVAGLVGVLFGRLLKRGLTLFSVMTSSALRT